MTIEINAQMLCRMDFIERIVEWGGGTYEIYGTCRLTGKNVIRYFNDKFEVFEFSIDHNDWIHIDDGISKNHSIEFNKIALQTYDNNIVEYKAHNAD